MNISLNAEEAFFVNEYIKSNRRERIEWELSRDGKRSACIWRFAHRAREFLKDSVIHPVHIKNGEFILGAKRFRSEIGNPKVFIIHPSESWDRKQMDFQEALDEYLGCGPYILIDCNLTFAFIETESDSETHEFLYLRT